LRYNNVSRIAVYFVRRIRMGFELKKVENNVATLEFNISSDKFKDAVKKAYRKNVSKFSIPGFRKGKAPLKIVERYYGEGIFYEDAIDLLFPDVYRDAVKETKIEPIDQPTIDIKQIGEDVDLVITADVTVKPDVKLGDYKGIEVEKTEYNVKDEDIENKLNKMRDQNARMVSADDRPIQDGDNVVIDYEGFVDNVPFEGGKAENYNLVIGSHTFIDGFEDQLIGKKQNENADIKVRFPDNYSSKDLAGKDALFKVTVKEIKYKELPEADDEFAKDVSEFDTLKDLKEDIKKKLEEEDKERTENEFSNNVIQKIVDNAKVDIPDVMIEHELDSMEKNVDMNLRYQGITLDKYFEVTGTSKDKFRENMRKDASNNVKTSLVLEKISQEEKIDVTDEEINAEIDVVSKDYQNPDKFKKSITDDYKGYISDNLKMRKSIKMLVNAAKPVKEAKEKQSEGKQSKERVEEK
jgi:trigger factor